MQHRGVMLSRGLVLLCSTSLFFLGMFVVSAGAQTADPIAGQTAFIEDQDDDGTVDSIGPIAVAGCTVDADAAIVVEDENGTQVELFNGQNATITGASNAITIEGTGTNGTFDNLNPTGGDPATFDPGQGRVVSSTGIACGDSGGNGGNGTASGGTDGGPDDAQYNADGKEVTVIVETIPEKKILVDTGGPTLPMIGGVILAVGLVGFGIFLLRRT
jgi:hypothetical protein